MQMPSTTNSLGKGVPENDAEAAKWYRMADEQGHYTAEMWIKKLED